MLQCKAESKIMFVCPRPPDPQFTPDSKNDNAFSRGKICLSFAEKTSGSMPGIRFESHMFGSSMDPRILMKYIEIHQSEKNCINTINLGYITIQGSNSVVML